MKTFQGRVVTPGCAQAEALVTHGGLNTLASFQKSLQFGDKTAKCGDQNNPDLYGKPMAGKALCLPQTIGSPGCAQAEALVSHGGLNTLASFQKSLQFGDKTAKCGDQNNPDLYGKPMAGKALCLPQTIGSTTGGLVLYCACAMDRQPACMLFANPIDSLAAAGAILADVWLQPGKMPVVDSLGEDFLAYVKDGMSVTIGPDGLVTVE